jgi:hypothetical protein
MSEEKPKSNEPTSEEKPASVAPVEADAEKPKSFIVDMTADYLGKGLIFTGGKKQD